MSRAAGRWLAVVVLISACSGNSRDALRVHFGPDEVGPGTIIHVDGHGCTPDRAFHSAGAYVRAYRKRTWPVGSTPTDGGITEVAVMMPVNSGGGFALELQLPDDAPPGAYALTVTCFISDVGGPNLQRDFTVTGGATPPLPTDEGSSDITLEAVDPQPVRPGEPLQLTGRGCRQGHDPRTLSASLERRTQMLEGHDGTGPGYAQGAEPASVRIDVPAPATDEWTLALRLPSTLPSSDYDLPATCSPVATAARTITVRD
jgi:hypothetical protein